MAVTWTEERIATLKELWESGATASKIAEALGGVSRNAVIGKAHRLGLKARPSPVKASEPKGADAAATPAQASPQAQPRTPGQTQAQSQPAKAAPKTARPPAQEPAAPKSASKKAEAPQAAPTREKEPAPEPAPAPAAGPTSAGSPAPQTPRIVSVGPGGFLRQGPGDQQAPIPPAPPRRLVPAKPSPEIADKTSLLDLSDRVCRWPMGHPGEPDFHFCGDKVNPGFPYCVEHCGRAYQAQLPRGARRPPPPLPFGGPRVR